MSFLSNRKGDKTICSSCGKLKTVLTKKETGKTTLVCTNSNCSLSVKPRKIKTWEKKGKVME